MSYAKSARTPLTRIGLSIRVFFLSLLLMGSTFTVISTMVSSQIFAQGAPKVVRQHITRPQSLTQFSTQKKLLITKEHLATQVLKEHRDQHGTSSTSGGAITTALTAIAATATDTPTPTATPIPPLGLSIVATVVGGPFEVGQNLVTNLNVTNTSSSTILDASSGVIVRDILALGTANIVATGNGWTFTLNSTTGPASLAGTYTGPAVAPGGAFPTITVTTTLTSDAVPVLTNTIALSDSLNPNTNYATTSVSVSPSTQTPTVTPTSTLGATPTPTTVSVPGISISANAVGGPFLVGQNLTLNLDVANTSSTTTLDAASSIGIGIAVPLGLTNIVTSGSGWTISQNVTTGPGLLVATYTGPAVAPGGAFVPFIITGTLTSDALPALTISSGISDFLNPGANVVTTIVDVSPATVTATATATVTAIATATVTATATATVTATATATVTATATATVTATATATVTATATATIIVTPTPIAYDETITSNVIGGPDFQVGQTLTWGLNVNNTSPGTSFDASSGVEISNIIPLGLSSIVITGNNWSINLTATTSPALFTAIYTGPAVTPGNAFPPLEVTGVLTSDAVPTFTNTAAVSDTLSLNSNLTTFDVNVSPTNQTATATPTITATVAPTPTATWSKPQLYIANSTTGSGTYFVGQTVNYALVIANLPSSFAENQPITVQDVFSVGLTHIVATGSGWTISLDNTTSPTLMTAIYTGPYPVASGDLLPMISISGELTEAAVPSLTSDATVSSADDPNPSFNTSVNTITVLASSASPTITPIASVTPTITMTPGTTPDLSIVKVNRGGDHFNVGDKVTYVIVVSNVSAAVAAVSPITVSDIIPLGLSNIEVKAPQWNVSVSNHSSPTIITADYNGSFPVAPGEILSPITITGTLNNDAVPSLTDTAAVDILGDVNIDNNRATDTVFVKQDKKQDDKSHHNNNNTSSHNGGSDSSHNNGNGGSGNGNNGGSSSSSFPGLPATGGHAIGSVWLSQYIQ